MQQIYLLARLLFMIKWLFNIDNCCSLIKKIDNNILNKIVLIIYDNVQELYTELDSRRDRREEDLIYW